jgi:hypothetical protein
MSQKIMAKHGRLVATTAAAAVGVALEQAVRVEKALSTCGVCTFLRLLFTSKQ